MPGFMMDRRRLMLLPAITIGIASCQYTFEKAAVKAEFADSKSVISISSSCNAPCVQHTVASSLSSLD